MNKTQLIEQLKKPEDKVNDLLSAAAIAADLQEYTDDHIKTLQAINEITESGKAKTYKAAGELYRKQQGSDSKSPKQAQKQAIGSGNGQPVVPENLNSDFEQFIQEQGNKMAEMHLARLPAMAEAEYNHLKAVFIQAYRKRIAEMLQDPEYRKQFESMMLGGELGKSMLSSITTSNIALPSSSSTSS